jgi:hypothetical protein
MNFSTYIDSIIKKIDDDSYYMEEYKTDIKYIDSLIKYHYNDCLDNEFKQIYVVDKLMKDNVSYVHYNMCKCLIISNYMIENFNEYFHKLVSTKFKNIYQKIECLNKFKYIKNIKYLRQGYLTLKSMESVKNDVESLFTEIMCMELRIEEGKVYDEIVLLKMKTLMSGIARINK